MLLSLVAAALLSAGPQPLPQPPPLPPPPKPMPHPSREPVRAKTPQIIRPDAGVDAGTAVAKDPSTAALACSGTEPFWALELTPKKIVLTSPDAKPVKMRATKPFTPSNRVGTWIWQTVANGKAAQLVLTEQACSDGMSDRQYRFKLLYIRGTSAMDGCCNYADVKQDGGM